MAYGYGLGRRAKAQGPRPKAHSAHGSAGRATCEDVRVPMSAAHVEALRELLTATRVLSLALIVDNAPVIGLLPFAATPDCRALVVHASQRVVRGRAAFRYTHDTAQRHALDLQWIDPIEHRFVQQCIEARLVDQALRVPSQLRRVHHERAIVRRRR